MSDWIEWNGGVCPVPKGTNIELRFRDNDFEVKTVEPEDYRWSNKGLSMDIVAYRVIGDFIAVDGVEYPYGCGAKVPPGRQIEPCRWDAMNMATHWRLKPVASAPIEVALEAAADDEPDDPSLLESQITGFMEGIGASDDHKVMIAAFKSLGISDATVNHMMCKLVGTFDGPKRTSLGLLSQAANIQAERAREYEQAGGERSTAKIVAAFNAITGRDLRESEGWLFLQLLKMVRGEAKRTPHMDSIVDNVSYAALYGEARAAGR